MKHLPALVFSLFFLIACEHTPVATSTGEHSSSSSSSSFSEREVSLSGDNGHAFLGEDEIALKDEKIFINNHQTGHPLSTNAKKALLAASPSLHN